MKIEVPGFKASGKLCGLIELSIKEFCDTNGLKLHFHKFPVPAPPFRNAVLRIWQERCHLEYPGKGEETHFLAIVTGAVFQRPPNSHWLLSFWPMDISWQERQGQLGHFFMVDLTTSEGPLTDGIDGPLVECYVKQALFNAWNAEESALDKFRREPIRL